ncbi:MAG TPA: amidohydrolase [Caulobacteraceae bacterium]
MKFGARSAVAAAALMFASVSVPAGAQVPVEQVRARAAAMQPKVVAWRRDIHANPELGNREVRTSKLVADHLRRLGMEVRTGVAHTGVVGVLKGGRPGGVVALRADMDALPVQEQTGLPFASKATGEYQGQTVPVAHACGHDSHVAMLMGAAEVLAGMKAQIPGTVVFVFQPAEEGPPPGETGGARQMIAEGALQNPSPTAIFGIHVGPAAAGTIGYRPEGFMAASDRIDISLKGKQTHGAWPWQGIDIVSLGAEIVSALNTVVARQVDLTANPMVLTIATVNAGLRYNIIPEAMTMSGTLRTIDEKQREDVVARMQRLIGNLAENYGATAEVKVAQNGALTFNDPALSAWLRPTLEQAAGTGAVNAAVKPTTVAEDFSYFQQKIPGVFYFLGAAKPGQEATAAPNHSPQFDVHEPVMEVGVRAHVLTALNYLSRPKAE